MARAKGFTPKTAEETPKKPSVNPLGQVHWKLQHVRTATPQKHMQSNYSMYRNASIIDLSDGSIPFVLLWVAFYLPYNTIWCFFLMTQRVFALDTIVAHGDSCYLPIDSWCVVFLSLSTGPCQAKLKNGKRVRHGWLVKGEHVAIIC